MTPQKVGNLYALHTSASADPTYFTWPDVRYVRYIMSGMLGTTKLQRLPRLGQNMLFIFTRFEILRYSQILLTINFCSNFHAQLATKTCTTKDSW